MAALGLSAPAFAGLPGTRPARELAASRTLNSAARSAAAKAAAAAPARRPRPAARQHQAAAAAHPRAGAASAAAAAGPDIDADVCILGAGIIGLCTALALLRAEPQLRVVLLDRQVPCSGATGAGKARRGGLFLASGRAAMLDDRCRSSACLVAVPSSGNAPRLPCLPRSSPLPLKNRARVSLAGTPGHHQPSVHHGSPEQGHVGRAAGAGGAAADRGCSGVAGAGRGGENSGCSALGWGSSALVERCTLRPHSCMRFPACRSLPPQPIGSMLIAGSQEESETLARRLEMLVRAGVKGAQLLTAKETLQLEPALALAPKGSALLLPSDVQESGCGRVHACTWAWWFAVSLGSPLCCMPACQLVWAVQTGCAPANVGQRQGHGGGPAACVRGARPPLHCPVQRGRAPAAARRLWAGMRCGDRGTAVSCSLRWWRWGGRWGRGRLCLYRNVPAGQQAALHRHVQVQPQRPQPDIH